MIQELAKNKPTLCLNMIVKNESHIIEDTLNKLCSKIKFDYWVISDTGSTDNTIELITKFFKKQKIRGEIYEDKWQDFAHNRSLALNYAYGKTDYLLIFDADDEIVGDLSMEYIINKYGHKDAYHLGFGSEVGVGYYRVLLINNRKKFRYRSVVHEFIECIESHTDYPHVNGNYYVISGRTSARNKNPNKFIDDATILENAHKKAVEEKDDLYLRYAYYCANSYFDAKKFEEAIKWYKITLSQPNWHQEKYNSCLHIFYAYQSLNQIENGIYYLIEAFEYDKRRVECVYELIKYYFENNKNQIAYLFYNQYKFNTNNKYLSKENNIEDGLFLKNHFFYFFYQFFMIIVLQRLNLLEEGFEMYESIFMNKMTMCGEIALNSLMTNFLLYIQYFKELKWSNSRKINFINNMLEFIEICYQDNALNEHKLNISRIIHLFLNEYSYLFIDDNEEAKEILMKKRNLHREINSPVKIIFTITTCKRLDLFEKTMNSILNNWKDIRLIDYFLCVDDNSSEEDRNIMKNKYPFFEFYFKTEEEKGHRKSMNIIWDKLNELKPEYWIHLEDDWLFYKKQDYVKKSINIMKKYINSEHNVSQVLFNVNYAETYEQGWDINGGMKLEKGVLLHEKKENVSGRNCAYWPHYSFRPSMVDVKTILKLGNFDSANNFFERDYADKYYEAGYKSCFFTQMTCTHIGKLTYESASNKPNAYSLNNLAQFNENNNKGGESQKYNEEEWEYFPALDSVGKDICFMKVQSKDYLLKIASNMPDCVAVNTLGFYKSEIELPLVTSPYIGNNDGIYIKKSALKEKNSNNEMITPIKNNKTKVKLICNWLNSKDLCKEWNKMTKGNYEWNDIQFTWEDDSDFFVIINRPGFNEFYIPERTIVFQMEPWCYDNNQTWGIKTWGEWAYPEEFKNFLQVRNHLNFYNNAFWAELNIDYKTFCENHIDKNNNNNVFSSICTSKYFDPGHKKRINFLKYIETKNDPEVNFHLYNDDNNLEFKSYKGKAVQKVNKEIGLLPYKYYFMCENNSEYNFITEKIWESILCECLVFYWGCPNVSDYINPLAYVQLDMDDFDKSFDIIKNAFKNNLWEERISIIKEEKQKILNYYSFCPTIERILFEDFKFSKHSSDSDIKNVDPYLKNIINLNLYKLNKERHNYHNNICFIHSCTIDTFGTEVLDELIYKIENSTLFNHLDYIIVNNIGNNIDKRKYKNNTKIKIINHSSDVSLFELPTLKLMHKFSEMYDNVNILYMHTKGISHDKFSETFNNLNDWKNVMFYFIINNFENCLEALKYNDSVSINYTPKSKKFDFYILTDDNNTLQELNLQELNQQTYNLINNNLDKLKIYCSTIDQDTPHWSGNYWWSKTNYIKNLSVDKLNKKHDAEWWILSSKNVKYAEIFNTHVDHYKSDYPKSNYINFDNFGEKEYINNINLIKNIYVINLDRRPDRKERVSKILLDHEIDNFKFYQAIDGSQLELTDEIYELFKNNDFGNRRSFIGCALSHYNLYKMLANSDEDYFIIMEDDISLSLNFKQELVKYLYRIQNNSYEEEIDFLYLGYHIKHQYQNDRFIFSNTLTNIGKSNEEDNNKYVCGNFGYIVTKKGAIKLLDYINKHGIKHGIDYLIKIVPELNNKICQPHIIFSEWVNTSNYNEVDSDIQKDFSCFDFSK